MRDLAESCGQERADGADVQFVPDHLRPVCHERVSLDRRCSAFARERDGSGDERVGEAFAAVALGILGDKSDLPLLSKVQENCNYLATTESLTEILLIY